MAHRRFRKGQSTYICRACGKRTRESQDCEGGVELCYECYEAAGQENTHSDSGHGGEFGCCQHADCKQFADVVAKWK